MKQTKPPNVFGSLVTSFLVLLSLCMTSELSVNCAPNLSYQEDLAKSHLIFDNTASSRTTTLANQLVELEETDLRRVSRSTAQDICNVNMTSYFDTIAAITSGNDTAAMIHFENLRNKLIINIVKESYAISSIDTTFQFVRELPLIVSLIEGLDTLYDEMEKHNDLGSYKLLTLDYLCSEILEFTDYPMVNEEYKDKLINLINKLKSPTELLINSMAEHIRNGQFNEIEEFNNQSLISYNLVQDNFLNRMINRTYDNNINNFDNIIAYVNNDTNDIELHGYLFQFLYDAMERNNHTDTPQFTALSYQVEKAMADSNFASMGEVWKEYYVKIKERFPYSVQVLMWHPFVWLESKMYPDFILMDNDTSSAYTISKHTKRKTNWKVMAQEDGKYLTFINLEYDDHVLYADVNGQVYTEAASSDYRQQWQLTPVEQGTFFVLKNRANNRILKANPVSECTDGNCGVVSTVPSYTGAADQQWKIY